MSNKISNFFKIKPKFNSESDLNKENLGTSAEVKKELEAHFDINLSEIESKVIKFEEISPNQPESWKCRVNLQRIKEEIQNENLKATKINNRKISRHSVKNSSKVTKNDSIPIKAQCKICNKKVNKTSLMRHMKLLHKDNLQFTCKDCNRNFISNFSLKKHLESKHGSEITAFKLESFECDFDGKVFGTKTHLLRHMRVHFLKIKCKFCDVEVQPRSITQHIKDAHTNIQKNCQCQFCQKSFKSINALNIHIKNHDKKWKCEICSKMFPSQGHLNLHKKQFHENQNFFECEICGKKFNLKQSLQKHQKTHDKHRPKPLKCQRCDYATDDRRNYKAHQKSHEYQDKKLAAMKNPLKCDKCPAFCRDKRTLRQHTRIVHANNPHQCDLCGNYYKTRGNVRRHINGHIKVKKLTIKG